MSVNSCPYCEQFNPADAKFCNACGGALHLVPCARCGAVNDVTATVCYQCHVQLLGRGADARDAAQPAAGVSMPSTRARSRVIIGATVLVAITVLGYYTYRQRSLVDVPQPPAASSEASGRGGSAGVGVIRRDATADDTTPAKANDSAAPSSSTTAPPENPPASPAPAAAIPPRADREPAISREAKAAAVPIARTKAISEGRASERVPARPEVCTEAAATLGLCTMKPDQKKEAESAAAVKAAISRPEAADAGKAGGQAPPRQESCAEAVAALGLCPPARGR